MLDIVMPVLNSYLQIDVRFVVLLVLRNNKILDRTLDNITVSTFFITPLV